MPALPEGDRRPVSFYPLPPGLAELYPVARWYACRTKARAEKQVDRLLSGAGFGSYLPLVQLERQWADRKKKVAFPLFAGYVFARFRLGQIHEILRTPGVVTVVRVNGYPTPIREEELESVRRLVAGVNESGVMPSPSDYLEAGQEVVVMEGPFKGMRGVLLEFKGRTSVVVRLSAIRQAVRVHIDRRQLRPA
jgi:transcription antitermination factor NusG